jgi:hypothetical protein
VKAALFLRIASVLTLIHGILHTIGGVLSKPRNGTEEIVVIETMKAHAFNVMGSMRTYWDFFFGYGIIATITLLVQAVLFWQLATLAKTHAALTRPILILFFFNFAATATVACRYFFIAPAITELLIAACLAAALFSATTKTASA